MIFLLQRQLCSVPQISAKPLVNAVPQKAEATSMVQHGTTVHATTQTYQKPVTRQLVPCPAESAPVLCLQKQSLALTGHWKSQRHIFQSAAQKLHQRLLQKSWKESACIAYTLLFREG